MPRLKKNPVEQRNSQILAVIGYYQNLYGLSKDEICLSAQMCRETYRRRLMNPGDFTVNELTRIAKKFHIPVTKFFEEGKSV